MLTLVFGVGDSYWNPTKPLSVGQLVSQGVCACVAKARSTRAITTGTKYRWTTADSGGVWATRGITAVVDKHG